MITDTSYKSLAELKNILRDIDSPTVVLLSKSAARRWQLEFLEENSNILWISQIDPNPTPQTLESALNKINYNSFEFSDVLAIGGGSALDLAKGIIALHPLIKEINTDSIRAAIVDKSYLELEQTCVNFTAIPSTSGTGSEATKWATVWDDASPAKFSIDAPWLYPDRVFLIAELTLNLSAKLTAATGMDAVSHAVEAFWARSTDSLSKALSIRAIEILVPALADLNTKIKSDNLEWRERLATGAFIAGLSFSRTRTTAGHSISYPLTSLFGVEHGFATTVTMAEVAQRNSAAVEVDELLEVFEPYSGIQGWIDNVTNGIIKLRLSSFGIAEQDISNIVEHAFTGGRMDNNPVDFSKQDVTDILKAVM